MAPRILGLGVIELTDLCRSRTPLSIGALLGFDSLISHSPLHIKGLLAIPQHVRIELIKLPCELILPKTMVLSLGSMVVSEIIELP